MKLVNINIMGTEIPQTGRQIFLHLLCTQGPALGGQHKRVPQSQFLQGLPDPGLADGIATGGIDIINAGILQGFQQFPGTGLVDALNGDTAKPQSGNPQPSAAKGSVSHKSLPFLSWVFLYYNKRQ